MLILFLKLLLAHILGDFVLQPSFLVVKRKENVLYLLLHVIIHAAVLCILFASELATFWLTILFIATAHLAIDSLKIWIEKKSRSQPVLLFVLDQFLHISVLVGVVMYSYNVSMESILALYTVNLQRKADTLWHLTIISQFK